jgi:hypothetical protein
LQFQEIFLVWQKNLVLTNKYNIMKKLAMVLAVAFTMGLAASTVNAATKDENKKAATTTCSEKDKKACCSSDKKACCASDKKAATPAPKNKEKK